MQTRKALGVLLGLLALSGCGGGTSSNAPSNLGRSASPSYAITDLGASPYYYYLYYGPEFGLYRSNGTVSINKLGQVISDASYRASYWQNGALNYLTNGSSYDDVSGLNDLGQFVGVALASSGTTGYYAYHATLWANSQATDLGTISGNVSDYSQAYAINNGGLIVGDSQVDTTPGGYPGTHAFLWQSGAMSDLGTLPGGSYSHASSISDSGQVVGWGDVAGAGSSYYSSSPVHAFSWQNGSITDLGTLPGGTSSDANSVNAGGQIAGSSETTASPQGLYQATTLHAYIWQGGKMTDIGTLGGPSSVAFAINSSGQVVGGADTTKIDNSLNYCYPLYPGGGSWVGGTTSGTSSSSSPGTGGTTSGGTGSGTGTGSSTPPPPGGGFNPIGGGASGASGVGRNIGKAKSKATRGIGDTYVAHAFVYLNGTMYDLNNTLPANSGWELVQATGISADGRIVGYGIFNQRLHAFVLQPQ